MPNASSAPPKLYWDIVLIFFGLNLIFLLLPMKISSTKINPQWLTIFCQSGFGIISLTLIVYSTIAYKQKTLSLKPLLNSFRCMLITLTLSIFFIFWINVIRPVINQESLFSNFSTLSITALFFVKQNGLTLTIWFTLIILQLYCRKKLFSEQLSVTDTTGSFGSAAYASAKDLMDYGLLKSDKGVVMGQDKHGNFIYLPLSNKLTISPPGGGKTTVSSIPVLLSHHGPTFVFDIKGELWATTARYRQEVLKRQVVVIDPYGITQSDSFQMGKSGGLTQTWLLNPFDFIPEDQRERDRMINAFAASFVLDEGGNATHFDENAKILIRGYIDYLMTQDKDIRNLSTLYDLMSEDFEKAELTFSRMSQLNGRAGAAANQIYRVGQDERGSILSTSYRQIDWMGDSNIQLALSKSNFDLSDFLKGNMDIFVVLPEDQIKEHHRLFRMILSLLMSLIIQAAPDDLPKQKMLFLFEELAQIGVCPDVEQAIEVLRARGVVVWTVFQTLSQIEQFKKPDLFKGATIKQIFTNDDTKTMEWIQTLAGKRTANTKTLSTNSGNSRHIMQTFGGTRSIGNGESVHETGVDLIPLNEIRELPNNEQLLFMHGLKPIHCLKTPYFKNPLFTGCYDENPLERS